MLLIQAAVEIFVLVMLTYLAVVGYVVLRSIPVVLRILVKIERDLKALMD